MCLMVQFRVGFEATKAKSENRRCKDGVMCEYGSGGYLVEGRDVRVMS